MKLSEYLDQERGRTAQLARDIKAHAPDVGRWAKDKDDEGYRPVPVHFAADIERATNGQVTRKDLFPEDWQRIWPELIPAA